MSCWPSELPAAGVVEFGQTRRVEARDAQRAAAGEVVEEIDQRRGQRLDAASRHADALASRRLQLDRLVVGNLREQCAFQPAAVVPEERGEQRGERQPLAFDDDAHVKVEPAALGFDEVGFPALDFQHVVAEVIGILDLPAGGAQRFATLLHEGDPGALAGQPVDTFRPAPEGVERMRRNLLEAGCGQRRQGPVFRRRPPLEADCFTLGQGDELVGLVRADVDVGVAENRSGDVEEVAGEVAAIAAPGTVAVRRDGVDTEYRLQRNVDHAQVNGRIFRRLWQIGRQLGQRLGDDGGFLGRQRRQAEQPGHHRRVAGDLERAGFTLGEVDIPGRLHRNDQFGDRPRGQQRPLQAAGIDAPADLRRARAALGQRQAIAVVGIQAAAVDQPLQRLGAVAGREAEGAQAGFMQAVGPQQPQDAEILLVDELRRVEQRTFDVPPFLGAVGKLALADLDPEMTLVGRPLEQIVQLLAGAGRACLFLGHGDRGAAQILDPRQDARADAFRCAALLDGAQQHRGDVLALAADRAGATAEQQRPAVPVGDQLGHRQVGLAGGAGDHGADEFRLDLEVADDVDVGARLVQLALAEPFAQLLLGAGVERNWRHARISGREGGRAVPPAASR